MSGWRLILDAEAHGAWNMGIDEALLASAVATGRPTLRFYHWDGPWLSVGYSQSVCAERRAQCERSGVGWVRRASGGRAVLHGADLTYALAAREAQLPAGLRASYELVAGVLLEALFAIGIDAVAEPNASTRPPNVSPTRVGAFDCFARAAGREICVGGKKLAGSAQRRAGGGVLQHGSIRLRPDSAAARQASTLSGAGATSLAELGADPSPEALRSACVKGFADALGADFEISSPTETERAWARARVQSHRRDPDFAPKPPPEPSSRQLLDSR